MKQTMQTIKSVLLSVFGATVAFISPIAGVLLAVGLFILLDMIIAYWRVKATKQKWTSKKMRLGLVPKFISYQLSVIIFFVMDKFILNDFVKYFIQYEFLFTKVIALTFIFIELKSIDENWAVVKGKGLFASLKEMLNVGKSIKDDIKNINKDKE